MARKKTPDIRDDAEKQWRILEYFIINESKQIEQYLVNEKWGKSDEISRFKTYPAKIEKELNGVSRATAGPVCEKLREMGILEVLEKEVLRLRGGAVNQYALKSDLNTLRILIRLIFDHYSYPDLIKLLDNYYFTYNISESLVKQVLAEKGVTITRCFSLLDFDTNSAQRLLELHENNFGVSESDAVKKNNVSEAMRSMVNSAEKEIKRDEQSHISELVNSCNSFLESVNDVNDSTKRRLPDFENLAVKVLERFNYNSYISYWSQFPHVGTLLDTLVLEFPIFDDSIAVSEKINKIKEINFQTFYCLRYDESPVSFSLVVESGISANRKILNLLERIERFLELPAESQSSAAYANEIDKLALKWRDLIKTDSNEFNIHLSVQLLKDLECIYANLSDKLERLSNEYSRDSDLQSMIMNVDHLCQEIMRKAKKHSCIKELTNEYIENNFRAILNEHYQKFEVEKVFVPILSLIHTSPLALKEFLNGEWDAFKLSFDSYSTGQLKNSEFISKLIHITSTNLLIYPKVLVNGLVQQASIEHFTNPDFTASLSNYHSKLDREQYGKLFDCTLADWYNNMSYTEFKSFEPTFLKIKLKHVYELRYMLSLSAGCSPEYDSAISARFEVRMNSELEIHLLMLSQIEDVISLILKLRSNDSKCEYIRKMLSTRLQNKIMFIDTDTQLSLNFQKELVRELNNVIMNPAFYNDRLFDGILGIREELKPIFKSHFDNKLSNTDMLRMVNEKPYYYRSFIGGNRYILTKIFRDEIEPEFIGHFERYLESCLRNSTK